MRQDKLTCLSHTFEPTLKHASSPPQPPMGRQIQQREEGRKDSWAWYMQRIFGSSQSNVPIGPVHITILVG
ncbi:uncharacterized protein H6S33_000016 [Morchella sextelata]|uniref:uncharacterized protein n=1 Tax=Morchella sextelata TaxID=1174677 RepID=UPI001D050205|nr:uncharacterized protein H6S33_000016 [Morchella sextelata]KAH0614380.1 hypothetical protein H6S33_000016 [Morchella sextelata]